MIYNVCVGLSTDYSTMFVSLSTELVHNETAIKQYITHKTDVNETYLGLLIH